MTYRYEVSMSLHGRAMLVMSGNVKSLTMKGCGRGKGDEGRFGLHSETKRMNGGKGRKG